MTQSTILEIKVDESQPTRVDFPEVILIIRNNSSDVYSNVNIELEHRRDIRLYPSMIHLERLAPGPAGVKKILSFQAHAAGLYVIRGRANWFIEGRNRHGKAMEVELPIKVEPAIAPERQKVEPKLVPVKVPESRVEVAEGIRREEPQATVQIFLSYAREDEKEVENLYQELSNAGFKPWMDKKDILPGERWESCIQRAIRSSDFFLACLSAHSVSKRGWIQKEIRNALDIWQEKLEDDIYLIPVRLEDCEVPQRLRGFQWVNLFEEDGWTRLVEAIQVGMERRA
jgi:hypothetical protein